MQELYAHSQSPLHRFDARGKVILALAFIFSLNLTPFNAWPAYILFLTLILSATLLSRLGIGFVLKRAMLALPFVLAALPLIFTGPDATPVQLLGVSLHYSPPGLERFASIALRSWISVQTAILLAATTRFPDLLTALQQIHVPRLFIAIIGLMWRYLFVISEEVTRMLRARSSRSATLPGNRRAATARAGGSLVWRARVTGGMAGSLFLRSLERSDRVYAAMLSRGYNGQQPVQGLAPLSPTDRRTLLAGVALLAALWLLGLLTGR
jgi:cobalt/nickel transport system permease protein